MKPKLLFHSNSPLAPTGYGMQTALFAPYLAKDYDLAVSAFYGLEGSRIRWNDIPILPGLGGEFGNEYLSEHARRWFGGDMRGGLLLTLMDVWVLDVQMVGQMNTACWTPIDHLPAPPRVMQFFANAGAVPLAMSQFGMEQLEEFDPIYVPHGVDTDTFKRHDQQAVREVTGVEEDAFVVGMVAANKGRPSRKGFQQAFEAFRYFRERHENAYLYLHTSLEAKWAGGEDISALLASLEIPPESLLFADQYRMMFDPHPAAQMAQIYAAMDVLLNPATGEGFGIPVMEAAACGVPAVVTDFSAMPEVAGPGWKVSGRPWWTHQNSWQAIADVGEIVDALEECYAMPDKERERLAKRCRTHALNYSAAKVYSQHLLPALEEVQSRFGDRAPLEIAA